MNNALCMKIAAVHRSSFKMAAENFSPRWTGEESRVETPENMIRNGRK